VCPVIIYSSFRNECSKYICVNPNAFNSRLNNSFTIPAACYLVVEQYAFIVLWVETFRISRAEGCGPLGLAKM